MVGEGRRLGCAIADEAVRTCRGHGVAVGFRHRFGYGVARARGDALDRDLLAVGEAKGRLARRVHRHGGQLAIDVGRVIAFQRHARVGKLQFEVERPIRLPARAGDGLLHAEAAGIALVRDFDRHAICAFLARDHAFFRGDVRRFVAVAGVIRLSDLIVRACRQVGDDDAFIALEVEFERRRRAGGIRRGHVQRAALRVDRRIVGADEVDAGRGGQLHGDMVAFLHVRVIRVRAAA